MTSLIGRRLGRYEIRAELGRGGMARVYRAVDTQLQRMVALKVLAAQLSLDPEFVRRFEREATTAANLRHPAIVTVYDVGEQDGLYYIAMEFVNGRSLQGVLEERTTLGLGYAVSLLDPVARALDYAHIQGAVHRDIKPHNILIDREGRVLLTDFGIAQTSDADDERLTRTGVFMGTPEYISPEQAEARRVDGRSDLYSLGVVAYEIITGRVPFSGATPQLIVAHAQLPPPPPTSVLAHLPQELDTVLARALAKRPTGRYATGQELADALRSVATRYGTPLATREQLAALSDVAGTLPTPPLDLPAPRPRPVRPQPVPPLPVPSSDLQPTERRPQPAPRPADARPEPGRPQPATGNGPARSASATSPRPQTGSGARAPSAGPRPLPSSRRAERRPSGAAWPVLIIGALLVLVTLALLFAVARGLASAPTPTTTPSEPTPGLLTSPSAAPPAELPTEAPTLAPTATDLPTLAPSEIPTLEPLPNDTATSRPPTAAPRQPTATTAPVVPSDTPVVPSDTPAPPSDTPVPPSATPLPPTTTPTATATANLPPPTEEPPILGPPTVVTPSGPPATFAP